MTNDKASSEWSRADRDLLITLNAKVDNLSGAVKDLTEGNAVRLNDHEVRLRKLEDVDQKYDPAIFYPELYKIKEEVHDFKTTAMVWRTVTGVVGGGVFFLLSQLPNVLKLVGWIK